MTTPESPSAVLRRAAQGLRELAGSATRGPWTMWMEHHAEKANVCGPSGEDVLSDDVGVVTEADGDWIATMSPVVGEPLAQWMDWVADYWEGLAVVGVDAPLDQPAYVIACHILGLSPS